MLPRHDVNRIYLYQIITLGLYFFYWSARSGKELNLALRDKLVPPFWWLILPLGGYWWMWQYTQALATLTTNKIKQSETFLLFLLVTLFWTVILDNFNLPSSIVSIFLPKTLVNTATSIIVYLFFIISIGYFCATVQNKLNQQAIRT